MTTALIYLVVMILVAAVVFLLASVVFGRGEELPALPPGASPTRLPASDITPEDVRDVRFQLVLRGYKMSEVDWVLRRVEGELADLRSEVAELRRRLAETEGVEDRERVLEPPAEPTAEAAEPAVGPDRA
ncbi:DivIVA domain-containing protein [Actinophytocola xanthii]|uniref:DivIVA domain-containing protein n=1 Tax=Actinophytocola xanthii TaxID=1912961 RepID=UPI0009F948E4|nr:DivIVA domain-containing protein [Actinophytocola xanthii]